MENSLDQLRSKIDSLDSQLVDILAKRAELTQQVGEVKSRTGMPIYVPSREAELITKRRHEAEQKGVAPALIEDLLRRIMRESYLTQNKQYLCVNEQVEKIVIVGGAGALGRIFVDMFEKSGYAVAILEQNDWPDADKILQNANLVLVAVPIKHTEAIIDKLGKTI